MTTRVLILALLGVGLGAQTQTPPGVSLPAAAPTCPELAAALRSVTANDARLKDWANLARYREANRSVFGYRRRLGPA